MNHMNNGTFHNAILFAEDKRISPASCDGKRCITAAKFVAGDNHGRDGKFFLVDQGAIGRIQIFQPPLVVMVTQPGMPGGNGVIFHRAFAGRITANGHFCLNEMPDLWDLIVSGDSQADGWNTNDQTGGRSAI